MTAVDVAQALRLFRFTYGSEAQLEDGIAEALRRMFDVEVERQVVLEDGLGRIDLLIGEIGIEVKIAGAPANVRRQILRYLRSTRIASVVLVTGRAIHTTLADGGKVEVVTLALSAL